MHGDVATPIVMHFPIHVPVGVMPGPVMAYGMGMAPMVPIDMTHVESVRMMVHMTFNVPVDIMADMVAIIVVAIVVCGVMRRVVAMAVHIAVICRRGTDKGECDDSAADECCNIELAFHVEPP